MTSFLVVGGGNGSFVQLALVTDVWTQAHTSVTQLQRDQLQRNPFRGKRGAVLAPPLRGGAMLATVRVRARCMLASTSCACCGLRVYDLKKNTTSVLKYLTSLIFI